MEKLHEYQGFSGRLHEWRDGIKERYGNWKEKNRDQNFVEIAKDYARKLSTGEGISGKGDDYSHIYRLEFIWK